MRSAELLPSYDRIDNVCSGKERRICWDAARRLVERGGRDSLLVPRAALEELQLQRSPPAAARTVLCSACNILSPGTPFSAWQATQQVMRRPDFLRRACACDPVVLLVQLHRATLSAKHARAYLAPSHCQCGVPTSWRDAVATSRRFAEDWSAGDVPCGVPSLLDISYCSTPTHELFLWCTRVLTMTAELDNAVRSAAADVGEPHIDAEMSIAGTGERDGPPAIPRSPPPIAPACRRPHLSSSRELLVAVDEIRRELIMANLATERHSSPRREVRRWK